MRNKPNNPGPTVKANELLGYVPLAEIYAAAERYGVELVTDWAGDLALRLDDAYRVRDLVQEESERHLLQHAQAQAAHVKAVTELRAAITTAFVEATGAETVRSDNGVLAVRASRPRTVVDGLEAARAVWAAEPSFDVRVEVHTVDVIEGDTQQAYDLATVVPRATVEEGIARAVRRANRAAG